MDYKGKKGLTVNGKSVWHEGNFNPADKADKIGGELVEGYPFVKPVIDDSLVLWLDGTTGNNYEQISVWKDLSGNNNHGELKNFAYTEDSGWVNGGLKFDGVDNYVQIPQLNLNPDSFSLQVDDKLRVFNGDKVFTESGDEWGRNLLLNTSGERTSTFSGWQQYFSDIKTSKYGLIEIKKGGTFTIKAYIKNIEGNEPVGIMFHCWTTSTTSGYRQFLYGSRFIQPHSEGYYEYTFDAPLDENISSAYIATRHTSDTIGESTVIFKNVKLEKGSQATPWTPAPEDIVENTKIDHNTYLIENNTIYTYRLYNRALTDAEILQNYQAGQCSPLLAMRGDTLG